jgi:hypothetical protein
MRHDQATLRVNWLVITGLAIRAQVHREDEENRSPDRVLSDEQAGLLRQRPAGQNSRRRERV